MASCVKSPIDLQRRFDKNGTAETDESQTPEAFNWSMVVSLVSKTALSSAANQIRAHARMDGRPPPLQTVPEKIYAFFFSPPPTSRIGLHNERRALAWRQPVVSVAVVTPL